MPAPPPSIHLLGIVPIEHVLVLEHRAMRPIEPDGAGPPQVVERLLVWEAAAACVVVPPSARPSASVHADACRRLGVPVYRRRSGGGAVVLGPGCLGFSMVLSLARRPHLADVAASYRLLLAGLAAALPVEGVRVACQDLALGDRKIAGHAQQRTRHALLHHGSLLYGLDSRLVETLLPEPEHRPPYRGARVHRDFLTSLPLSRDALIGSLRRWSLTPEGGRP